MIYGSRFKVNGSRFEKMYLVRKTISMFQRIGDLANHLTIFPLDTLRFFPSIVINGIWQK